MKHQQVSFTIIIVCVIIAAVVAAIVCSIHPAMCGMKSENFRYYRRRNLWNEEDDLDTPLKLNYP
jgi:hypothetical protein